MVEVKLSGAKPVQINETPGMCGGFPHIEGRRIRVAQVVEAINQIGGVDRAWKLWGRDILPRSEFRGAYRFYQQNPARVREDIARELQLH